MRISPQVIHKKLACISLGLVFFSNFILAEETGLPPIREGLWDNSYSVESIDLGIPIGMESGMKHLYCINKKTQLQLIFQTTENSRCKIKSTETLDSNSYIIKAICSSGSTDEEKTHKIIFNGEYNITSQILSNSKPFQVLAVRQLTYQGECPKGFRPGELRVNVPNDIPTPPAKHN